MAKMLLIFVDGVGLAPSAETNPLAQVAMPAFEALLGGPLTSESVDRPSGDTLLQALDATLGVDGLPQSATGQTSLFTGENAAALMGRHVPAFPGGQLIDLIQRHGVLARLVQAGLRVGAANAYRRDPRGGRRLSVTTHAILAAKLPIRRVMELRQDRAVSWDVCRDHFARGDVDRETIAAAEAGRHLAALAAEHDFLLYETFMTDLVGHRRFGWTPGEALRRLDGLLEGFLEAAPDDLTLVLTSDHGNLEDASTRRHTRNPVPLLAHGPLTGHFNACVDLTDVAGAIVRALGVG